MHFRIFSENVERARERRPGAHRGHDVAQFQARFGGSQGGGVAVADAAHHESQVAVQAQHLGQRQARDSRIAHLEVADLDGVGRLGARRLDAEYGAIDLKAEHHAQHAEGIGDTEGDDRLVHQLL